MSTESGRSTLTVRWKIVLPLKCRRLPPLSLSDVYGVYGVNELNLYFCRLRVRKTTMLRHGRHVAYRQAWPYQWWLDMSDEED